MTISAQQILHLKENVKKLENQRIRAEANYEQAVARLKELGYDNIEDAETTLEEMQQAITEHEAELAEDVHALLDQYPDLR